MKQDYTLTKHRIFQWLGIILAAAIIAVGYWYFRADASKIGVLSPTGSLTSGLVGYWNFDRAQTDSGTAYDRSTSKYNGSLANSPTLTNGAVGQAIDLNGSNQYVNMGNQSNLNFGDTADFSISGWFSRDTFTTADVLVAKRNAIGVGETGYSVDIEATDQLVLRVSDGASEFRMYTTTTFTTAEWKHFTVVFDQDSAANTKFYINGQAVSTSTAGTITSVGSLSNAIAFMVGSINSNDPFDGKIDEIRVYNRVLTDNEITTLYNFQERSKTNTSVSQPQGTGRLDSGLALYWPLDDGTSGATPTTATDSSTNGNTGTLTGGPMWTTGQVVNAVDFDGIDDYVTVADPSSGVLDVTDSTHFTLSGWFNRDTFTADHTIIAKRNGQAAGDTGYVVYVDDANDDLVFEVSDGTDEYSRTSTSAFTSTGWRHFAVVFDDIAGITIYINGVENQDAASGTLSAIGSLANAVAFRSGAESDAGSPFDGKLDEVRMYNRALSADEVKQLYSLTSPTGVDTSLKGYWSFNGADISGTTAYDRSGAGNTGTLTNSPQIAEGRSGQGLYFFPNGSDNNSFVDMGDPSSGIFDFGSGDFSVGFWMRGNGYNNQGHSNNVALAKKNMNTANSAGYIFYYSSTNLMRFAVANGTSEYSATQTISTVADSQWHHYIGVRSGSEIYLYVDGVLVATTTSVSGSVNSGFSFVVGTESSVNQNDRNANAIIDEVRVYNAALSLAQIKAQYDAGQSDKFNSSMSQPQGTGRLDSGLAGYWPLDDGTSGTTPTTATDSSPVANNGTLQGSATWTTGQIGNAVNFSGSSQYISTSYSAKQISTTTLTYAAWVAPGTNDVKGILGALNGDDSTSRNYCMIDNAGSEAGAPIVYCYLGIAGNATLVSTQFTSANDVWFHMTLTYDGVALRLYIDGVLKSTTAQTGAIDTVADDGLMIGRQNSTGGYFTGKIDEVRMYTRALSADEVVQLYRLTTPTGVDTSLKGYWSFNGADISGTTAYDRSGAGNTGTTSGSPAITEGKIGQGIALDGNDDYVSIADADSIDYNYNQDFSFSVWVKLPSTQADTSAGDNFIVEKWSGSGGYPYTLRVYNQTYGTSGDRGKVVFRRYDGTNSPGVTSTSLLNDNNWHHVVGTKSGSQLRLYVDGASQATATDTTTTTTTNTSPLYIGTRGGSTNNLTASVDELRLYNRTLSADEVAALYNQGR